MALTGTQVEIAAGEHAATVVAVGAGLRSYTLGGRAVTETYGDDVLPPRGCGAVLVPWPNRLRGGRYEFRGTSYQLGLTEPLAGNAIHGLGRWARWDIAERSDAAVTMALDVVPQTGYPFEVRVEVTYALDAARGLSVTAVARNTGAVAAPFGAGFHPYVALGGVPLADVVVNVPAETHLVVDDAKVPVRDEPVEGTPFDFRTARALGDHLLDDGFTGFGSSAAVEVRAGDGGARVRFDAAFGFAQVFTLPDFAPGRAAVAVEPMSCPADAFNSGRGLVVLEPGASWTGAWGIEPL